MIVAFNSRNDSEIIYIYSSHSSIFNSLQLVLKKKRNWQFWELTLIISSLMKDQLKLNTQNFHHRLKLLENCQINSSNSSSTVLFMVFTKSTSCFIQFYKGISK